MKRKFWFLAIVIVVLLIGSFPVKNLLSVNASDMMRFIGFILLIVYLIMKFISNNSNKWYRKGSIYLISQLKKLQKLENNKRRVNRKYAEIIKLFWKKYLVKAGWHKVARLLICVNLLLQFYIDFKKLFFSFVKRPSSSLISKGKNIWATTARIVFDFCIVDK